MPKKNGNPTKAIAPLAISEYAIVKINPAQIRALIADLPDTRIDPVRDLDRVGIPTGGGQFWTIPTLDDAEPVKEILGVIVAVQSARAYWPGAFQSGGQPPSCVSADGITGEGDPGGECVDCEFARFGSSEKTSSRGQACKSVLRIFVIRPQSAFLPLVVNLPPTSLADARKYLFRLLNAGTSYHGVVTRLTLTAAQNADGVAYSKGALQYVATLDPREQTIIEQYRKQFLPILAATPPTREDYPEDE